MNDSDIPRLLGLLGLHDPDRIPYIRIWVDRPRQLGSLLLGVVFIDPLLKRPRAPEQYQTRTGTFAKSIEF
jgi:hypothetical protein